jgi:hypothetical protein
MKNNVTSFRFPLHFPLHIGEVKMELITSVLNQKLHRESSPYSEYLPSILRVMGKEQGLTEKDLTIIYLTILLRCISIEQLYRLLYLPNNMTQRACQLRVQILIEKQLLSKLDRRLGGLTQGSAFTVISPGILTCRYINARHRYFKTATGGHLIMHSLTITEIFTQILEANIKKQFKLIHIQTEPVCWREYRYFNHPAVKLKPDLYVEIKRDDISFRWFIEVDRGTLSKAKIQEKAWYYEKYFLDSLEQRKTGILPRTLWITLDKDRAKYILSAISKTNQYVPGLCDSVSIDKFIIKLTEINSKQYK